MQVGVAELGPLNCSLADISIHLQISSFRKDWGELCITNKMLEDKRLLKFKRRFYTWWKYFNKLRNCPLNIMTTRDAWISWYKWITIRLPCPIQEIPKYHRSLYIHIFLPDPNSVMLLWTQCAPVRWQLCTMSGASTLRDAILRQVWNPPIFTVHSDAVFEQEETFLSRFVLAKDTWVHHRLTRDIGSKSFLTGQWRLRHRHSWNSADWNASL